MLKGPYRPLHKQALELRRVVLLHFPVVLSLFICNMYAQKCRRPPGRNALCTVRREIKNAVPSVVVYALQCQVYGWWSYLSSVCVRVVHQIRDDEVRQAIVQLEHCAVAVAFQLRGYLWSNLHWRMPE